MSCDKLSDLPPFWKPFTDFQIAYHGNLFAVITLEYSHNDKYELINNVKTFLYSSIYQYSIANTSRYK